MVRIIACDTFCSPHNQECQRMHIQLQGKYRPVSQYDASAPVSTLLLRQSSTGMPALIYGASPHRTWNSRPSEQAVPQSLMSSADLIAALWQTAGRRGSTCARGARGARPASPPSRQGCTPGGRREHMLCAHDQGCGGKRQVEHIYGVSTKRHPSVQVDPTSAACRVTARPQARARSRAGSHWLQFPSSGLPVRYYNSVPLTAWCQQFAA